MGILGLLLPALLPVVADGFRSLVGRFFGGAGAQPQNVEEAVKLMSAEVEKLKAIAELDRPSGEISRWVADLRASFRYLAAGVIITMAPVLVILDGSGAVIVSENVLETVLAMAASVFSFMFGDRLLMHLRPGKK